MVVGVHLGDGALDNGIGNIFRIGVVHHMHHHGNGLHPTPAQALLFKLSGFLRQIDVQALSLQPTFGNGVGITMFLCDGYGRGGNGQERKGRFSDHNANLSGLPGIIRCNGAGAVGPRRSGAGSLRPGPGH